MRRGLIFAFPDKKFVRGGMAVELPVDPPGIIPRDIRPVIDKIVGFAVVYLPPGLAASRLDRKKDSFFRRPGSGQKPGAFFLGNGKGHAEKAWGVEKDKCVGGTEVGPSFPYRQGQPLPLEVTRVKGMG
jgi:hypothetical protein